MSNKSLTESNDENILLPPTLNPKQIELSKRLDDFYQKNKFKPLILKPSEIFISAIYGMQEKLRSNPDWISQVANSLRELLYPIWYEVRRRNRQERGPLIKNKLKQGGYIFIEYVFDGINDIYGKLNDLAHHGVEPQVFTNDELINFNEIDFEKLVESFENLMLQAFSLTLDVFDQIDRLFSKIQIEGNNQNSLKKEVKDLITEQSTKDYFYYKVNEHWLDWLWENGFLDVIKQKAEDPARYSYKTPELNYLVKVAEEKPEKVAEIISSVSISENNFNPEVIDQFLRICCILPAAQLIKIVPKIRDEHWIQLMRAFNKWGFEYRNMLQTLDESEENVSLLMLAESLLSVQTKEELKKSTSQDITANPFYLDNLSYTKVFKHLANISDKYTEQALELTTKIMAENIFLFCKKKGEEDEKIFKFYDKHILLDVDFFILKLSQKERLSPRDNVRELASVIKLLTQRLIGNQCNNPMMVRALYEKYIGDFNKSEANLPDSRAMWRLRLFVLSLCPEVFKDKLKNAFFRLFEVENYNKIISGAEYERALQKGFSALAENDKRVYVKRVIEYFPHKNREEEEKKGWDIRSGTHILSMISDQLTKEEKQKAKAAGFKLDPSYEPHPSIVSIESGFVLPRGPITQEEFGKLTISDIAKKMKTDWTPEKLRKQKTIDDFLNPINAEGAGNLLRNDIPNRMQEYLENSKLFFERGVLDQHYTYSFLWGVQEVIKNSREAAYKINWNALIELCIKIIDSGKVEQFDRVKKERESFDAWLAGWDAVYSAIADVVHELLSEKSESHFIDFQKHRRPLLKIISYLLIHPDPTMQDEEIKTAKSKIKSPEDPDSLVSDPFTVAINSVRGRAFQAFVLFVYKDGKSFKKQNQIKINKDVQKLYERVLKKENTRALMFMFGYYLPTFYFRSTDWIHEYLRLIFPLKTGKNYLYLAAWEGYLTNNLYEKMFFDPKFQALYELGLNLQGVKESNRKYFKDPDDGLAVHLALAYMHYVDFGYNHKLFKLFWQKCTLQQHSAFISFIGRMFISGKNPKADALLKKKARSENRIKKLWKWLLENYENPELFTEFGYWINLEKDIFEPKWLAKNVKETLLKTEGALDWDHGLTKSITELANNAAEDILIIARLYLLNLGKKRQHRLFYLEQEWIDTFKILYKNKPEKTQSLINDLIQEGGQVFWKLKEVLN